ncbi:MAG: ATP-dependent RecD-like DNA helicase [Clostridia bacterium]|nr:ATP-dependent RecD-like DNA helicase [Clostridia bacterium]
METERLEGSVAGTVFRNEENGYSVIMVKAGRKAITCTGILPELAIGEQVVLTGTYVDHPQYGSQLKVASFEIIKPTTLSGIERFLASGLIKGVKTSSAKQIVEHFGEETLEVLSEHPERLQEIRGFGKKRWKMVAESYHQCMYLRNAMVFLQTYSIPSTLAQRIARKYGSDTEKTIRENPYRLCMEIDGIGFQTVDRIAASMGIAQESEYRLKAGLIYVLQEQSYSMGHCYLPAEELLRHAGALLHAPDALLEHALEELAADGSIKCERTDHDLRVYLPVFFQAEADVASRLLELYSSVPRGSRKKGEQRIRAFEARHHVAFSALQREAILSALEFGVLIITGGPGTGKTTIIRCIISLLQDEGEVTLCAPTGRAAKRMSEATGQEARTIHRLLESTGEGVFGHNEEEPLETSCVIVDEMSMVDILLMRSLLCALSPGTRLILVGDADQLPSVGAGNVLGDLLASSVLPAVRLTDIYRQSEESRIVVNAHRINHGEMPVLNEKGTDFFFERKEMPRDTAETIVSLVATRLPGFIHCSGDERAQSIQVLAPQKKGDTGVIALNVMLQEALNPPAPDKPSITWGDRLFRKGDKVMQTKNDYNLAWIRHTPRGEQEGEGVFNGDIGTILDVDEEANALTVRYDEDRDVEYSASAGDLDNLDLAYAMTVHKSQGCEFPVVVIPVCGGPRLLLTRNLFYTALTRARSLVVLVGREQVIRDMVENNHIAHRYTALSDCLYQMSMSRSMKMPEDNA